MASTIINKLNEIKAQKDNFIKPENLKPGINVFNVVSNMPNLGDMDVIPNGINQTFSGGYLNSLKVHKIDATAEPNLTSANIANGKVIFGVTGSFIGEDVDFSEYFNFPNNEQTNDTPFTFDSMTFNKVPYNISENAVSLSKLYATYGISVQLPDMDVSNVKNIDQMFLGSNLKTITGNAHWNFSEMLEFPNGVGEHFLFKDVPNLVNTEPIGNWNISLVSNISGIATGNLVNANLVSIGNWNTSNVISITNLIKDTNLGDNQFNISNWNVSNVVDFSNVIDNASFSNLECLNFANAICPKFVNNIIKNSNNITSLVGLNIILNDAEQLNVVAYNCINLSDISVLNDITINDTVTEFPKLFMQCPNVNYAGLTNLTANNITELNEIFPNNIIGYGEIADAMTTWNLPNLKTISRLSASFNRDYITNYMNYIATLVAYTNATELNMPYNVWGGLKDGALITAMNTARFTMLRGLFQYANNIDGITSQTTANAIDISRMFENLGTINVSSLQSMDVSMVQNMSRLFYNASSNINFFPIRNWNTSNVKDMSYMFYNAGNNLDAYIGGAMSSWDVSNVENMQRLFARDYMYGNNQHIKATVNAISSWNTSNVKDMSYMFYNQTLMDSIGGVGGFNLSNVNTIASMFYNCINLNNTTGLQYWNTSNVQNMAYAFYNINANADLSGIWSLNMSNVRDMQSMLYGVNIFNILNNNARILAWDLSNVERFNPFNVCGISEANISWMANVNLPNLKSLAGQFPNVTSGTYIGWIGNWDTSKVENMCNFLNANINAVLTGLSNLDVSNVKNMVNAIRYEGNNNTITTGLNFLANWNTINVTNMHAFIHTNANNVNLMYLSNLDVSNVVDMSNAFYVYGVKNLNFTTNWDVSNVLNFSSMFDGVYYLNDISGVGNWNINPNAIIYNFAGALSNVSNLAPLGNWNINCNVSNFVQRYSVNATNANTSITFLENWKYYGKLLNNTPQQIGYTNVVDIFQVNTFRSNYTDAELNAIVNLLQNVDVTGLVYNIPDIINSSEMSYINLNNGMAILPENQKNTTIDLPRFTLGVANIGIINLGEYAGMGYNQCNNYGVGLNNSQLMRIKEINPTGYNNLINNGWVMTGYNYFAEWISFTPQPYNPYGPGY